MVKIIKKITKVFSYLVFVCTLIPFLLMGIIQIPVVQNYAVSKLLTSLSGKVNAEIRFSAIRMTNFNRVRFSDLLILDPQDDTLIYAAKAVAVIPVIFNLISKNDPNEALLRKLRFEKSDFNLAIDSTGTINLKFFIDFIESGERDTTLERKSFKIKDIRIIDSRFTLRNETGGRETKGIDFADMQLNELNIHVQHFMVFADTVKMDIDVLSFIEQSGFRVNKFSAQMDLCSSHLFYDDVCIETPASLINAERIRMTFGKFKDYNVATLFNKVKFDIEFKDTKVNLSDIGYFTDFFWGVNQSYQLQGSFSGPLSNFDGDNIKIGWGASSQLLGKFDINGLPDISTTFLVFDLEKLYTNTSDILTLNLPGNRKISLPENLAKFKNFTYKGNFTGFFNDFVSHGRFNSDLGEAYTDLMIVHTLGRINFSGKLRANDFNIGIILGKEGLIEDISADVQIEGNYSKDSPLQADIKGEIDKFTINKYNYRNISVNGSISNKRFNGQLNINDPNFNMEFQGLIDLSVDPWLYDFKANIIDADLYNLKISDSDVNYHASFLIKAKARGKSIDELNGEINLVNSLFTKTNKQIQIYDLNIITQNSNNLNEIIVRSDILDGEISGRYSISELKDEFLKYFSCYLPALTKKVCYSENDDYSSQVNFNLRLKRTQPFFDFFFPDYMIGENTEVLGLFYPGQKKLMKIDIITPLFRYKQSIWKGLVINVSSDDTALYFDAGSHNFNINRRIDLENYTLHTTIRDNLISFSTRWLNWDTNVYRGNLSGTFLMTDTDSANSYYINLNPSSITISDSVWHISDSKISIDPLGYTVDNMSIYHNHESILVYGKLSDNQDDSLHFTFRNFDLGYLNFFTRKKDVKFAGTLDGGGHMTGLKINPLFFSSLQVDDLFINDEELGFCTLSSIWNNTKQSLSIEAKAERGTLSVLQVVGDYFPMRDGKMDFKISLDKLKTDIFNPFLSNVFSDISGMATGNLELSGIGGKPILEGKLKLQENAFTINYLKTRYNFTTDLEIVNNNFLLDNIEVFDEDGNSAVVNGMIRTEYLKDIFINLNINAKNFLCLDTKGADNSSFYGKAYTSGSVKIKGSPASLHFDIDAKTGKNTKFNIPLSEDSEVSAYNYISFNRGDTATANIKIEKQVNNIELAGMQMNFNLDVTPDAEVQIIFDSKMGDIIKAKGTGQMKMSINTLGTFELLGEYIIDKGEYLFTLDVINRRLKIEPGSTLRWTGDPLNAQVDITAVYPTKASLKELFPNDDDVGRVDVNCKIFLTGDLMSPIIKYDIYLPNADERIRERVKSKISSDEQLTRQVLYLLVLNSFYPEERGGSEGGSSTGGYYAGVNASELLSNQLSNWLSQLSDDIDIGVNYRPGKNLDPSEVELALSKQLLDDRLSINGSLDIKSKAEASSANNLVGDFDLDYKLNKSGKIRLSAFYRMNDDNTLDYSSQSSTGIGVFFVEEFNTLDELFDRYWAYITGKKKKKKKSETNVGSN